MPKHRVETANLGIDSLNNEERAVHSKSKSPEPLNLSESAARFHKHMLRSEAQREYIKEG